MSGLLCLVLQGCALFGKAEPFDPNFYSPEQYEANASSSVATEAPGMALRLGRIVSGSHLRERIAYQSSARQVGFYDGRHWTERPESYLRRAVTAALFEQAGLTHVISGPAPTLELELIDFTEVRSPKRLGRVRVRAVLSDGRTAFLERFFTAEQPVRGDEDEFEHVVDALALALQQCVRELTEATVLTLRARPPEPATSAAPAAPADVATPATAVP
jgi:cholesterol transport system auxiliary component